MRHENQWLCTDGCDRRAPVRDLYTSRCPGEVYVGCSSVSRGGAIIRPDSPGASRAGSGDWAFACDVPSAAMLPARMKEAIRFRVIGGSFQRGDLSFAGLSDQRSVDRAPRAAVHPPAATMAPACDSSPGI